MALEQRYSSNESLERVRRVLSGEDLNDQPGALPGQIFSSDENLSMIAKLLQGTLTGETFKSPLAEYGGLYNYLNSDARTITSGSYTLVQDYSQETEHSSKVAPSQANSWITINDTGIFKFEYHISFYGMTGTKYMFIPYWNDAYVDSAECDLSGLATGTLYHASGVGILNVDESGKNTYLYVNTNRTAYLNIYDISFVVQKLGSGVGT